MFDEVCQKYYNNNVYQTLKELLYHMIMNFLLIWQNGLNKVEIEWEHLKREFIKN